MLQKLFGFNPVQHKVRIEIYAGITTFLTMAYILAMNPSIFSALEPQEYAKGFYESVGFRQSSDTFMLDGIPHIKMAWNN